MLSEKKIDVEKFYRIFVTMKNSSLNLDTLNTLKKSQEVSLQQIVRWFHLQLIMFKEQECQGGECMICLENKANVSLPGCNHEFCEDCITAWYACNLQRLT